MAMIKCPECGADISDKAKTCPHCGVSLTGKKFCKFCGEKIDEDCIICPKCGKQLEELKVKENTGGAGNIIINNNNSASAAATAIAGSFGGSAPTVSPKSWLTTLILCILLGALGGHRIYVGKVGTGILMFLLMFNGIGEVWLLIDLIMIIIGKFTDKSGLPVKR